MHVIVSGSCIDDLKSDLPAGATTFTFAAGAIKKKASSGTVDGGTAVPDNCEASALINRTLAGTLDKGYANGSVQGIQSRSVTFTTVP
jgi:hypothetical protein